MTDATIRERLRELADHHFPTTRAKRPGWEVCDHDSMTWPCETQKALDLAGLLWAELDTLERRAIAAESRVAEAVKAVDDARGQSFFDDWADEARTALANLPVERVARSLDAAERTDE